MDEEPKLLHTIEKNSNKNELIIKRPSKQKIKQKAINNLDKKFGSKILINGVNNNNLPKSQLPPTFDRNSINIAKKHNSIAYSNFQNKLITNSSYKNLDYKKNNNNNLSTTVNALSNTYLNTNPNMNNLSLGNIGINTQINGTINLNPNLKEKEKEIEKNKEILNSSNRQKENELYTDHQTQRLSLLSASYEMNINNQNSLLENKNTLTCNVPNPLNPFSHQNSINNFSLSSDSTQIKVIVRFRPLNNVENVSNLRIKKQIITT